MKKEHLKAYILLITHFSHCSSVSLLIPQISLFINPPPTLSVHSFVHCVCTQTNSTPPHRCHFYILNSTVCKINFYCYMWIFLMLFAAVIIA